jgi:hypothetical protein
MAESRSRYWVVVGKELRELPDTESMVSYLSENEKAVIFTEFSGFKLISNNLTGKVEQFSTEERVDYDLYGKAKLVYGEERKGVTNTFNIQHVIRPISEALVLIAKKELLLNLAKLKDPAINAIIETNHIDKASGKFTKFSASIDRSLERIRDLGQSHSSLLPDFFFKEKEKSPLHKLVSTELDGYENIKGKSDAKDIFENIRKGMTILQRKPTLEI